MLADMKITLPFGALLCAAVLCTVILYATPLRIAPAMADAGAEERSAETVATADSAERGARLAYTCLGCHGIEGYRNAYPSYRVPRLGGQHAAYLAVALRGYRDGSREHPTMTAQAATLSDQDIDDLAAYFAGIVPTVTNDAAAGNQPAAAAPTDAIKALAACVACHGENGIGLAPTWPTLAGQHEDYLVHALQQYRDGNRQAPLMAPMAASLSDRDIRQLARHYARQPGVETTRID